MPKPARGCYVPPAQHDHVAPRSKDQPHGTNVRHPVLADGRHPSQRARWMLEECSFGWGERGAWVTQHLRRDSDCNAAAARRSAINQIAPVRTCIVTRATVVATSASAWIGMLADTIPTPAPAIASVRNAADPHRRASRVATTQPRANGINVVSST